MCKCCYGCFGERYITLQHLFAETEFSAPDNMCPKPAAPLHQSIGTSANHRIHPGAGVAVCDSLKCYSTDGKSVPDQFAQIDAGDNDIPAKVADINAFFQLCFHQLCNLQREKGDRVAPLFETVTRYPFSHFQRDLPVADYGSIASLEFSTGKIVMPG